MVEEAANVARSNCAWISISMFIQTVSAIIPIALSFIKIRFLQCAYTLTRNVNYASFLIFSQLEGGAMELFWLSHFFKENWLFFYKCLHTDTKVWRHPKIPMLVVLITNDFQLQFSFEFSGECQVDCLSPWEVFY